MKQFNPELLDKERILAISKCDLLEESELKTLKKKIPANVKVIYISSHTEAGLTELKDQLWNTLNKIK